MSTKQTKTMGFSVCTPLALKKNCVVVIFFYFLFFACSPASVSFLRRYLEYFFVSWSAASLILVFLWFGFGLVWLVVSFFCIFCRISSEGHDSDMPPLLPKCTQDAVDEGRKDMADGSILPGRPICPVCATTDVW